MTYYTRKEWGARDAEPGPGFLIPANVHGVALHWPAMATPLSRVQDVQAALRAWQNYHMGTHGWSDIAYQLAFDQAGNVYKLRGIRRQSAANGDVDVNEHYGAFLLILGPGEQPTEAMMRAVRRRVAQFRDHFPGAQTVVGHGDIRPDPTECPGPAVRKLIAGHEFNPPKRRK